MSRESVINAFELVYPESKKMTVRQGYYQKLLETEFDHPKTRETMKTIRGKMEQYLSE